MIERLGGHSQKRSHRPEKGPPVGETIVSTLLNEISKENRRFLTFKRQSPAIELLYEKNTETG